MKHKRFLGRNTLVFLTMLILLAANMTSARAQILIVNEQEYLNNERNGVTDGDLPSLPFLGLTTDQYAPLGGSEVLVLGCLAGAYLLGKRKKKNNQTHKK